LGNYTCEWPLGRKGELIQLPPEEKSLPAVAACAWRSIVGTTPAA